MWKCYRYAIQIMNNFSPKIHLSGIAPRVNYPTVTIHCQRALQVQLNGRKSLPAPRFNTSRQQHQPKYKLKVCVINVNGLNCLDKRVAFHAFLHTEQPDVLLGQESKLDSTYSNSEIFPPNYNINVIRNDRDIHGGGVFIIARNELDQQRIQLFDNSCPLVLAKLKVEGRPLSTLAPSTDNQIINLMTYNLWK